MLTLDPGSNLCLKRLGFFKVSGIRQRNSIFGNVRTCLPSFRILNAFPELLVGGFVELIALATGKLRSRVVGLVSLAY